MNEEELEHLVVRLTGDGSSYHDMIQKASTETDVVAKHIETATRAFGGLGAGLTGFGAAAAGSLKGIGTAAGSAQSKVTALSQSTLGLLGVFGVATSLQGAFNNFQEFEKITIRLNAAIEANGRNVEEARAEYDKYIATVTSTTLNTKWQTMGLLKQAEAYGYTGKEAEKVVTTAIALAGAQGGEASSYLRIAQMIEQGNLQFARRILGLQGVKDETELATKVQQRLTSGLKVAQAEFDSSSGRIAKLKVALGGMATEVGRVVSEVLGPFIDALRSAVKWFNDLDPAVKKTIAVVAGLLALAVSLGPIMAGLSFILAPVFTLLGAIGSALAFLVTPAGMVTSALVILAAALADLAGYNIRDMWNSGRDALLRFWTATKGFLSNFNANMAELFRWLNAQWQRYSNIAVQVWHVILRVVQGALGAIASLFLTLVPKFNSAFDGVIVSAKNAWEIAAEYVRQFTMTALGFMVNFEENMNTLFSWLGRNWKNLWTDTSNLTVIFWQNTGNNAKVGLETIMKILLAFMDWSGGFWEELFGDRVIGKGLKLGLSKTGVQVIKWAQALYQDIQDALMGVDVISSLLGPGKGDKSRSKQALANVGKDLTDATKDGKLMERINKILEEQGAKLKSPFAGFKSTLEDLPELNFKVDGIELPKFLFDQIAGAVKQDGLSIEQGITEPIKDATKEMHKFDAAVIGSVEATARLAEYADLLDNTSVGKKGKHGAHGAGGDKPLPRFDAADAGRAEGLARKDANTDLLKDIRDILKEGKDRGGNVDIDPADFA